MNPLSIIYIQYRTINDIVNIVADDVLMRSGPTSSLDATLILIYWIFSGCYVARNKISDTWWRHQMETFSALLAFCAGNSPVPVNSPHKGQWREALMLSFICAWTNSWLNNRDASVLRHRRAHYDVTVIRYLIYDHHQLTCGPYNSPQWAPGCCSQEMTFLIHDDVIKWRRFPRRWPFVRGIHRSPVNSPHKGQWRGALMFSLICTWTNSWVNNRDAPTMTSL